MEKKKLKRQKVDEKFDVKTRESISPAGFLSLSLARSSTRLMKSCCPPVCVLASRRYPRICRDNKQVCLMCDRKAERRTGGEGDERTSPELFD